MTIAAGDEGGLCWKDVDPAQDYVIPAWESSLPQAELPSNARAFALHEGQEVELSGGPATLGLHGRLWKGRLVVFPSYLHPGWPTLHDTIKIGLENYAVNQSTWTPDQWLFLAESAWWHAVEQHGEDPAWSRPLLHFGEHHDPFPHRSLWLFHQNYCEYAWNAILHPLGGTRHGTYLMKILNW